MHYKSMIYSPLIHYSVSAYGTSAKTYITHKNRLFRNGSLPFSESRHEINAKPPISPGLAHPFPGSESQSSVRPRFKPRFRPRIHPRRGERRGARRERKLMRHGKRTPRRMCGAHAREDPQPIGKRGSLDPGSPKGPDPEAGSGARVCVPIPVLFRGRAPIVHSCSVALKYSIDYIVTFALFM